MAYPGANILSFDGGALHAEAYETLEHGMLSRTFLNNPQAYLRHLIE